MVAFRKFCPNFYNSLSCYLPSCMNGQHIHFNAQTQELSPASDFDFIWCDLTLPLTLIWCVLIWFWFWFDLIWFDLIGGLIDFASCVCTMRHLVRFLICRLCSCLGVLIMAFPFMKRKHEHDQLEPTFQNLNRIPKCNTLAVACSFHNVESCRLQTGEL